MSLLFANFPVLKAIPAEKLEEHTLKGWRLLSMNAPENMLILGQDSSGELAQLNHKLVCAGQEFRALSAEKEKLDAVYRKMNDGYDNQCVSFEATRKELESVAKSNASECIRSKRFEDQLGKLRRELGDREFNRIVDEKVPF